MDNLQNVPNTPQQKFPTVLLILLFSAISLAIGFFLGSARQSSSLQTVPAPAAVVSPIVSTPSATPTVDPTTNWKVYKNEKYGFEFKYPTEGIISEKNITGYVYYVEVASTPPRPWVTNLGIYEKKDTYYATGLSCEETAQKEKNDYKYQVEEIDFQGVKGWKILLPGGQNPPQIVVCLPYEEKTYDFQFIHNNQKATLELFDQILSTFKFTEKEADKSGNQITNLTIPLSWKTYDKVFGASSFFFRFPETHEVQDGDVDSGEIYISRQNSPSDVAIDNILHIFQWFEEYKTGSRRDWFKKNMDKNFPSINFSGLTFEEINLSQGKSYLLVGNWPDASEIKNGYGFQGDLYFGFQNNKIVYFLDKKTLPKEQINLILSSLEIK